MHHDHHMIGLLGLALGTVGLLRKRPKRTDADRLADLDRIEQAAIARAANPHFIAAAEKRERKRLKRLGLLA